jgi:hypothetical protein
LFVSSGFFFSGTIGDKGYELVDHNTTKCLECIRARNRRNQRKPATGMVHTLTFLLPCDLIDVSPARALYVYRWCWW